MTTLFECTYIDYQVNEQFIILKFDYAGKYKITKIWNQCQQLSLKLTLLLILIFF